MSFLSLDTGVAAEYIDLNGDMHREAEAVFRNIAEGLRSLAVLNAENELGATGFPEKIFMDLVQKVQVKAEGSTVSLRPSTPVTFTLAPLGASGPRTSQIVLSTVIRPLPSTIGSCST